MDALLGNYLPDEASGVLKFSTMNRQDGHLQFDPSGVTSDLTHTISWVLNRPSWPLFRGRLQEWVENKRSVNFHRFGLGNAGGPIDSRVGDLCNHVGFTNLAAPRGCWRLFEQKKPLDSRLREGVEHSIAPYLGSFNLYLREKCAKTDLLYLTFNSLSFVSSQSDH
jgi:hypothetical protein